MALNSTNLYAACDLNIADELLDVCARRPVIRATGTDAASDIGLIALPEGACDASAHRIEEVNFSLEKRSPQRHPARKSAFADFFFRAVSF